MADETDLKVGIEADVSGQADTKALADAVALVGDALSELVTTAKAATRGLSRVEQDLAGIKTQATQSAKGTQELASALGQSNDASRTASQYARDHADALGEVYFQTSKGATEFARAASTKLQDAAATREVAGAYKDAAEYAAKMNSALDSRHGSNNPDAGGRNYQNISTSMDAIIKEGQKATSEVNRQIVESMKTRMNAEDQATAQIVADSKARTAAYTAEFQAAQANEKAANTALQNKRYAGGWSQQGGIANARNTASQNKMRPEDDAAASKQTLEAMRDYYNSMGQAVKTGEEWNRSLIATRYALHDVSNGLFVAGAGLIGFNALIIKAAADYETAFANIERTSGLSGDALNQLRGEFIELAQTIPTSFAELSKIGTLAGQLNIPATGLADFTKTVAMFSATTNVAVEQSAESFGRLDTLLPDVKGNYEALGSSILTVGVNSVATESQIISTTNQIAAAGAQANLSASEVIGLAASFASLGVAPEASRGTAVRVLSEINDAVNGSGDNLESFAKLSNMTASQFRSAWEGDAGGTLVKVFEGIGREGGRAEQVLRGMGITAVRDINALLRLGQNAEVVGANFAYAAQGFNDGTQLGDAFAITAETVNSKLQMLVQSVQAFFATIGESGLGPLGIFIDILRGAVNIMTELANNPIAQWSAALIGLLTALGGAALLVSAGIARIGAGAIALRQVGIEFTRIRTEAGLAAGAIGTTKAALDAAGISANALKAGLISTGIGAAVVVAFGAIGAAVEDFNKKAMSASEAAKTAYGDLSALSTAISLDTAAGDGYTQLEGTMTRVTERTSEWVGEVERATGGQMTLSDATTTTTTALDQQTFSFGKNAQAVVANMLANDQLVQKLVNLKNELSTGGTAMVEGAITAITRGDIETAERLVAEFEQRSVERANKTGDNRQAAVDQQAIDAVNQVIKEQAGALELATTKREAFNLVSQATGLQLNEEGNAFEDAGNSALAATDAVETYADSVSYAFASTSALGDLGSAFTTLAQGLIEMGVGLDVLTEGGRMNVENLQQAIVTAVAAGEALGISATESVGALFNALQQKGVDTARLLAQLSNIKVSVPGVDMGAVGSYASGSKALGGASSRLAASLGGISLPARKASKSISNAGRSAKKAAAEVRTLVDYAGDLGKVFNRSFELRFGNGQAMDKISTGWQEIAEKTREANAEIRSINASLSQLAADKKIQQYFLGVAIDYGDELRAQDIRAKLGEITADTAEKQQALRDAQAQTSRELEGNSAAAIENRDTILGLVSGYQAYVEQLASSGMEQGALQAKVAQLKQEFIAQATQLGYSKTEVSKYARSFDDMSTAIQRVPRNITVRANTDPAIQALNEFMAAAKRTAGSGVNVPFSAPGAYGAGISAGDAFRDGLIKALSRKHAWQIEATLPDGRRSWIGGMTMYSTGGRVYGPGSTTSDDVNAALSKDEYVVKASAAKKIGYKTLDMINNGQMPTSGYSSTGTPTAAMPATMVVELSSYDRALLARAGNVSLQIGQDVVARASNGANLTASRRGGALV